MRVNKEIIKCYSCKKLIKIDKLVKENEVIICPNCKKSPFKKENIKTNHNDSVIGDIKKQQMKSKKTIKCFNCKRIYHKNLLKGVKMCPYCFKSPYKPKKDVKEFSNSKRSIEYKNEIDKLNEYYKSIGVSQINEKPNKTNLPKRKLKSKIVKTYSKELERANI